MNVRVHLAGHTAAWRFRATSELDGWLAGRPWTRQGGVRVARLAGPEHAPEMAAALRRAVLAHEEGAGEVRVLVVEEVPAGAGLRGLLAPVLELPDGLGLRPFLERLAGVLDVARTVVVFSPPQGAVPGLVTEAEAIADQVRKLEH